MPQQDEYVVVVSGDLQLRFNRSAGMALDRLTFKGSPNLINSIGDYGREFQACLWEGNPTGGDVPDFWDMINPTQAGMAAPRQGSRVLDWRSSTVGVGGPQVVWAEVEPLDYVPKSRAGGYRIAQLQGRWPKTGWNLGVNYRIEGNSVRLTAKFSHADPSPRKVQSASITAHLEPLFVGPFVNDEERQRDTWCREAFSQNRILVDAPGPACRVHFIGHSTVVKGRFWDLDRDGNYGSVREVGCSKYVNPADVLASDLVVLQADYAPPTVFVSAGQALQVEAELSVTETPMFDYWIPLRNVPGLYGSSLHLVSDVDMMVEYGLYSEGSRLGAGPWVIRANTPKVVEVAQQFNAPKADLLRLRTPRRFVSIVCMWQDLVSKAVINVPVREPGERVY